MPDNSSAAEASLKKRTANTVKWNLIDRVSSQLLYAVTGIILANLLSPDDFGLVGAVLVFQAFASLLVDSGFASALIQRKQPTRLDYSSVLWFNIAMSVALYIILWFCAPFIAMLFGGDERLVDLSRVMFISFVINGASIVQGNILLKKMDVRMAVVSNCIGLAAGAVAGITLALYGYGPWAIVWQTLVFAVVRVSILWCVTRWKPVLKFSYSAFRTFVPVASKMLLTSFLNTLFLNIYSFFIGNRVGLASLGYYTQSDKWSKMSVTCITQVLTGSFMPVLSAVQDEPERFARITSKMNRSAGYVVFPATIGVAVLATPVFHTLFGTKWDPSIILFQLLLIRGIFTALCGLYNNYLLALGRTRDIVAMEILRDTVALAALFATMPFMAESTASDPVYGLTIMMWGQLGASALTWAVTLVISVRAAGVRLISWLGDLLPYFVETLIAGAAACAVIALVGDSAVVQLIAGALTAVAVYMGINAMLGSQIQRDTIAYLRGRLN